MYLRIKVTTDAKREHVVEKRLDTLEVWLKEIPENNMANRRLLEVLSGHFKLPVKRFKIVSGHKKSTKLVLIREGIEKSSV